MGKNPIPREFELIAKLFVPLTVGESGALGLTDDAAILDTEDNRQLVVTTDTLVSGIHFLPDTPPHLIAAKLLGVNLSDLAAMGATPRAYTLNAVLPRTIAEDDGWLTAFVDGLATMQEEFSLALIGGDTVSTNGPLTLTVCAFGTVEPGKALRRNGAGAGDRICVSGSIGDAALGLEALQGNLSGLAEDHRTVLVGHHQQPRPRLKLGQVLASTGLATAAIDISDGLLADLGHLCTASGADAEIKAEAVPLSDAARSALEIDPSLLPLIYTGGDDYELLFTVSDSGIEKVMELSAKLGVPITNIGAVLDGQGRGAVLMGRDGKPMDFPEQGFSHF